MHRTEATSLSLPKHEWIVLHALTVVLLGVFFWDYSVFKGAPPLFIVVFRLIFAFFPYLLFYSIRKSFLLKYFYDFVSFNYLFYTFFFCHFVSYNYCLAYGQFILVITGLFTLPNKRYYSILFFAFVLCTLSVFFFSRYPDNIPVEQIRKDLYSSLIFLFIFPAFYRYRFFLEKEKTDEKERFFSEIGKKLSFLLHEIKGPLQRLKAI